MPKSPSNPGSRYSYYHRRIDEQAQLCCRRMESDEREAFLAELSARRRGRCGRKPRAALDNNHPIFDIDGREFERLWNIILPYARAAMLREFPKRYDVLDLADDIAEVRYKLLHVLRFLGPTPQNIPLSASLYIIVRNVVTLLQRARFGERGVLRMRTKNFCDLSPVIIEESLIAEALTRYEEDTQDLLLSVPVMLRPLVEDLLSGEKLNPMCRRHRTTPRTVKRSMSPILNRI